MKKGNRGLLCPLIIIGAFIMLSTSCKKDDDPMAIGKSYQGGIIAYRLQIIDPGYDPKVRHGIIAAPSDQSTGIKWYNGSFTLIGAIGTEVGAGKANTDAIVASQGEGSYAAKLCSDLVLGGYDDWYLPSKDELDKLYLHQNAIGGFSGYYWSSSETGWSGVLLLYMNAWSQSFFTGEQLDMVKSVTSWHVRAIRAF
jgi:hypothetical protein